MTDPTHEYLSTACHHGLHDRCRRSCKFCSEGCRCECHTDPGPGRVVYRVADVETRMARDEVAS